MPFSSKLYPITDVQLAQASHAEQVACLAEGGANLIQLRDKHLPARRFYEEAREAMRVAANLGVKIVINDRVDLALILGASGVHLGQNDVPPGAARYLLGDRAIIGVSTHSIEQAVRAAREPVDYLAFGPIFPTTSKSNSQPVLGLSKLRAVRGIVKLPLVAIGGITRANVQAVISAGADAVAVIADLLGEPGQITLRTRAFLAVLQPKS